MSHSRSTNVYFISAGILLSTFTILKILIDEFLVVFFEKGLEWLNVVVVMFQCLFKILSRHAGKDK